MNSGSVEPLSYSGTRWFWVVTLLVCVSFGLFASVRAPVPAVNEPHYLCKARNFWDPTFCPNDPFLQSANAHYVFYLTIGSLTSWLSLPAATWVGRVLGWLGLATGWSLLVRQILPQRWAPLWGAWILLGLAAVGNFSGEWIVGGVEAKVFGYACVFASIAFWQQGRRNISAFLHGLAISFHPVIGVWSVLCLSFAVLMGSDFFRFSSWNRERLQSSLRDCLLNAICLLVGAIPGLIPALMMLGGDPELSKTADYIQVFHRLKHHLDPSQFPQRAYVGFCVLIVAWGTLWWLARLGPGAKLFRNYLYGALLLAAVGLGIGLGPRWPGLMKFYPFRLADACLPVGFAIAVVGCGERWLKTEFARGLGKWGTRACAGLCAAVFVTSLLLPAVDRNPSRLSDAKLASWLETCEWIRQNTPAETLCLTPQEGWAFKWYAHRAEYVNYKDCPQDAAGIVDWNDRIRTVYRWSIAHQKSGYTDAALQELRDETGIDYVIASRMRPFFVKPDYQNKSFRVYKIADLATPE